MASKKNFRKSYCTSTLKKGILEAPFILGNLNENALEIIRFVLNEHNKGKEDVKSGDIYKHVKKKLDISKDYFQKIRQQLVRDNILTCTDQKGYYFISHELRHIYESLFLEQEKVEIINKTPLNHFILEFFLDIKENDFDPYLFIKEMHNLGYSKFREGCSVIELDNKETEIFRFYNKDLIKDYLLITALEKYADGFSLTSDLHLTENNRFLREFIMKNNFKKTAYSICLTNNLKVCSMLKKLFDCNIKKIEEAEGEDIDALDDV